MVKKKRGRKPKVRDYYEGATGGKCGGEAGEGDRGGMRERAKSDHQQPVDDSYNGGRTLFRSSTTGLLITPRLAFTVLSGCNRDLGRFKNLVFSI